MSLTLTGPLSGPPARRASSRRTRQLPPRSALRARPVRHAGPVRRVRHEVRDGMAVIAFSAAASSVLAFALMLLLSPVG